MHDEVKTEVDIMIENIWEVFKRHLKELDAKTREVDDTKTDAITLMIGNGNKSKSSSNITLTFINSLLTLLLLD